MVETSGGTVALLNGQTVPIVQMDIRGMFIWTTQALVAAVAGPAPNEEEGARAHRHKLEGIHNFLERVYFELRNLGSTPQERAINFAATNAFQLEQVFRSALERNMQLDEISVERSPICRPGADCWDVKLIFFQPLKRLEQARLVYRFTVDVSDVIPVTVGAVRSWHIY